LASLTGTRTPIFGLRSPPHNPGLQGGSSVRRRCSFPIDKRPFEAALAQAQADYAKAVAAAQLAKITLGRQTQLYETKVISQQEYDTSYENTQASLASVAAAQANVQTAQINMNYCSITAPFDGIVVSLRRRSATGGPRRDVFGSHPDVPGQSDQGKLLDHGTAILAGL
jgi:multidrug efflux pump subunit AcrA (membrane-fusion protein)